MKEFKKGDNVRSVYNGMGEVVHVFSDTEIDYPIIVVFDSTSIYNTYTRDGRMLNDDKIDLTHIEEEKPQRPFLKGDRVESEKNGSGEVIFVDTKNYYPYPIVVGFDKGIYRTYTNDGRLAEGGPIEITHIDATEEEFKVGGKVKSDFFGHGVIVQVDGCCDEPYPIMAKFTNRDGASFTAFFTTDGRHVYGEPITLRKI